MNDFHASLLDFQTQLVALLLSVVPLGVALIGLGLVISGVSSAAGYRVKRLGLQIIGACLIVILAHSVLVEVYATEVPLPILLVLYATASLVLLQGLLTLLFGPSVGNSVITSLLTSLMLSLAYLLFRPITILRDLFR